MVDDEKIDAGIDGLFEGDEPCVDGCPDFADLTIIGKLQSV
jgi:hypothetical protein